ncbi:MAG: energy-coupling factor transporter transmembrane protein EcfT [Lachnospiraceae bacterium]|nr:energy-coupling factor transporter transmembrane protein EcfT [Lachnospiraceae bacterium]
MMRNMTIGQFYNVDSPIHRLDPRVKIVAVFMYVISLFFINNAYLFGVAFIMLAICIALSKVPLSYIIRGTKGIMGIIIFTVLIQLFTVNGANVLVEWHFIKITTSGVRAAVFLFVRLVLMIVGSSMMTYTTTPNSLTDGLEKLLSWLKVFHIPVHELAMIMSIALRFIPVLVDELDRIMKAQMARGVDFNEGNLIVRVKRLMAIIVPLFVSVIRRSDELALAMDARCYHGESGRTKMKPLRYKRADYVAYALVILYIVALIVLKKTLHISAFNVVPNVLMGDK